jgi:hypothetical protein
MLFFQMLTRKGIAAAASLSRPYEASRSRLADQLTQFLKAAAMLRVPELASIKTGARSRLLSFASIKKPPQLTHGGGAIRMFAF